MVLRRIPVDLRIYKNILSTSGGKRGRLKAFLERLASSFVANGRQELSPRPQPLPQTAAFVLERRYNLFAGSEFL